MNDAINVGVFLEDLVDGGLVRDVDRVELRALAADDLDAVDSLLSGIVEVVDDDDLVSGIEESECGEGTNVPAATGGDKLVTGSSHQFGEPQRRDSRSIDVPRN